MTASAGSAGVESTLCTRISSPTIATRSVNVPPVSIPTSIGPPSLPLHGALSRILKLSGFFAASNAAMPSSSAKVAIDQRSRIDFACRQGVERGLKPAASRADHSDFIHDDRREVKFGSGGRSALQYDSSARADQFDRAAKAGFASTAIDHDVEFVAQSRFFGGLESELSQPCEFFPMMSRDDRQILLAFEHERDERAEPAVAEHHNRLIPREMSLLENFVRRRERLDEHRNVVGNRIGNRNQVDVGEPEDIPRRRRRARGFRARCDSGNGARGRRSTSCTGRIRH